MKMEDRKKILEEKLREAACFCDSFLLKELLRKGVDVNSKNQVNGWTALHWAAHRNYFDGVFLLLSWGADKNCLTNKGESPSNLSSDLKIQKLLGGTEETKKNYMLPIIPNYLKELYVSNSIELEGNKINHSVSNPSIEELVLKVKTAKPKDLDFIEIELPKSELTLRKLEEVCANELNINVKDIEFIRKLPNTRLRKDKDIHRLKDFQELEVVVLSHYSY